MTASGLALASALFAAAPAWSNPSMSDDFTRIMEWLTRQTARSLAFNAGSTFDPPNEMKVWRMQPDISFGLGVIPYDKTAFPAMQVSALAEKDPAAMLPDKVMYPNLTAHVRLGLPQRMDMGLRFVNVTIPRGHRLSDSTSGDGQINTIGVGLRRHFFGGRRPLLSMALAYNRVFGHFNFMNQFKNVELTPGLIADSVNTGRLEWDVCSLGLNAVVSQAFGRWTPFAGAGLNHMFGAVSGRLEGRWQTPLIEPSIGMASGKPEPAAGRMVLGVQRDGSIASFFVNSEIKATGAQAGRAFVLMTGIAAPFRIGAASSILSGRDKKRRIADEEEGLVFDAGRTVRKAPRASAKRRTPARRYGRKEELIFIR
ncbi:MAG: hypothetical protein HY922_11545 [Elusimicrobia bacterium]|nr:hypothetical protein [Elusimicrobiota bacterium]